MTEGVIKCAEDQFWLIVLSYTVSGCLECDKGWTGEEAEWESI